MGGGVFFAYCDSVWLPYQFFFVGLLYNVSPCFPYFALNDASLLACLLTYLLAFFVYIVSYNIVWRFECRPAAPAAPAAAEVLAHTPYPPHLRHLLHLRVAAPVGPAATAAPAVLSHACIMAQRCMSICVHVLHSHHV